VLPTCYDFVASIFFVATICSEQLRVKDIQEATPKSTPSPEEEMQVCNIYNHIRKDMFNKTVFLTDVLAHHIWEEPCQSSLLAAAAFAYVIKQEARILGIRYTSICKLFVDLWKVY